MTFEPKIITFMCNWCGYAAADLAGVSRLQYPATVRIIRTMCTGRFDPGFVLRAFEKGADGVLICGCHPGDCQYIEGNLKGKDRVEMTQKMLEGIGIDPERLRLEWVSASEGPIFAELVREFSETIRKKGPNPLKESVSKTEGGEEVAQI
jgi:F420-non-reducing hydrogenase iron-sulfur subunit